MLESSKDCSIAGGAGGKQGGVVRRVGFSRRVIGRFVGDASWLIWQSNLGGGSSFVVIAEELLMFEMLPQSIACRFRLTEEAGERRCAEVAAIMAEKRDTLYDTVNPFT